MQLENGKLYVNYGTKDEKVIGEIKEIKTLITLKLGSDCLIVNEYMIHEVCKGYFCVYSPEILKELNDKNIENIDYIDYPTFNCVTNAINYCLGFVNDYMLETESDLKEYLERNGK
jgi:hypothetical protein